MSVALRASLLVCSVLVLFFVMRRIRKAGLEISDSIFWLALSLVLIVIAVFPQIAYWASDLLGFDAPVNFVFFCGIIVLLVRTFSQDQKICQLKKKLIALVQDEALRD
ncbi:DUF2304 domain-containing protein [Thermophilibacter provencensis]|uniref:DUF2304 domain-containing protein n=1 Tax=Thermophilibacter provencensis TaxID=1852386 RepID=A0ABT7V1K2_9ACTN|nr:DUF2304 domain-containing protein [Thermophilibacter provencensis]MDM8270475.1 DUF2304 domain-containing protein [Thermophilibacter provencensis]